MVQFAFVVDSTTVKFREKSSSLSSWFHSVDYLIEPEYLLSAAISRPIERQAAIVTSIASIEIITIITAIKKKEYNRFDSSNGHCFAQPRQLSGWQQYDIRTTAQSAMIVRKIYDWMRWKGARRTRIRSPTEVVFHIPVQPYSRTNTFTNSVIANVVLMI